jgi:hypothetical protein
MLGSAVATIVPSIVLRIIPSWSPTNTTSRRRPAIIAAGYAGRARMRAEATGEGAADVLRID